MIRMPHLFVGRFLAAWAVALGTATSAQPVYHIEPIGIPDLSQAIGTNNRGAVVGYAFAPLERAALLKDDGSVRLLSSESGLTFGAAVNESNHVVYNVLIGSKIRCGAWNPATGRYHDLGTLGGGHCNAADLNDLGQVVGSSSLADGRVHAFLRDGTEMHDLGTLGGRSSAAHDINNHGQITGTSQRSDGSDHAFILQGDVMTDLGDLGGGTSAGTAINVLGHVAGTSSPNGRKNHDHAFLWDGREMHDLGTLGGKFSYAYAINRHDEVVGISRFENERDPAQHAYLHTGGVMYSLMDLLDSSRDGWEVLIYASGINDHGEIVGLGIFNGHQMAYRARRVSN